MAKIEFKDVDETVKTTFIKLDIPPLEELTLSPAELDSIIKDVIGERFHPHYLTSLVSNGFALLGVGASLFSEHLSWCYSWMVLSLAAIFAIVGVCLPCLKRFREPKIKETVNLIKMEISCFQINQKRISDIIAEEGEIMTGVGDAINDEILRMQRGVEDLKRRKKRVNRDFKKSKKKYS